MPLIFTPFAAGISICIGQNGAGTSADASLRRLQQLGLQRLEDERHDGGCVGQRDAADGELVGRGVAVGHIGPDDIAVFHVFGIGQCRSPQDEGGGESDLLEVFHL